MAILRRGTWLSQVRVDAPMIKSVESAVSNDFDDLFKSLVTGTDQGYVIRGFNISMASAVGGAANNLQVIVDPGALLHINASQSGTVFLVPDGTTPQQLNAAINTSVTGAFVPNSINYVGIDYIRFNDPATSAQQQLWDPTTDQEDSIVAPLASVLNYQFIITTTPWATNVLPIATVSTDSNNNVTSITDARFMLFRLGTGGATPNPFFQYPWPEGRNENPSSSSNNSIDPFSGGDKAIANLKDFIDAIETSFLEIKGGPYWYSPNSAGSISNVREDLGNTIVTGNTIISHSQTTAGQINWASNPSGGGQIYLRVVGGELSYKITENPSPGSSVVLGDNEVAYITLQRDINVAPNLIFTNGSTSASSVGAISWASSLQAGDWVKQAADTYAGYVQIASVNGPGTIVTLTAPYGGTSTDPFSGSKAQYAFGVYTLPASTGTARDIQLVDRGSVPISPDTVWLFFRTDDAGATPRVYIKFFGEELEQGESRELSDGEWDQIRTYIGMPTVVSTSPGYVSALSVYDGGSATVLPQISQITAGSGATVTGGQYFYIYSSGNSRKYYVWFKVSGVGSDPLAPGANSSIEVDILTGDTAAQVATKINVAMSNIVPFKDFTVAQVSNVLTVTNNSAGTANSIVNFNVGAPFAVATLQAGTGTGNFSINDGDSLTLAIKKLDNAIESVEASLDSPTYDETVTIVASGATPPTSLNGPISSLTNITLPNNSRLSGAVQYYTVGKGVLQVFLNGQYLILGNDWAEVGVSQSPSKLIQILRGLVVGDELEFRISGGGGGGGGGGGMGPPGPAGPSGPPGADAAGGPIAISTKTSNYGVLLTDCFLKADCTSGGVTFALPTAASATGRIFYFKKVDVTANAMTLLASGAETIDGSNTQFSIVQYETFSIISDGISWNIF